MPLHLAVLRPAKLRPAVVGPILAATLLFAPCALAQQGDDPDNLAGERVSPPAHADTLAIDHGAPALEQLLLKLRTRASMMMIVAHPDDEDGGLLTYESRGQGARVAMLTLTRGEGGQNLVSADFNDALGLIRTQELLAADRYMGVDQMFGTEVDFGFSKTLEETFAQWTHDRVLYDAVRCVRLYRPLVLASVFVGGVTDGHGHHQAAGEITQEVFTAAADPKVFPEMKLPPWAPWKVYARVPFFRVTPQGMFDYATGKYSPVRFHNYVTGKDITHEPLATVEIHEGEASQRLGMDGLSYVQFARKGLALQKTQIGASVRLAPAGAYDVGYTLMASRVLAGNQAASEQSLFDGIDTSLPAIASLAPNAPPTLRATLEGIAKQVAEAQRLFAPKHLEATAPPLREALRTLDTLLTTVQNLPLDPDQKFNLLHEFRVKRVQLNDALLLAHGLTLTAASSDPEVLTTQTGVKVNIKLQQADSAPLRFRSAAFEAGRTSQPLSPERSGSLIRSASLQQEFNLGVGLPASRSYFYRTHVEQPVYLLSDQHLRNAPATLPAMTIHYHLMDDGVPLTLDAAIASPSKVGGVEQAVAVVPPVSVTLFPASGIVPLQQRSLTVEAHVSETRRTPGNGTLRVKAPAGWHVNPATRSWASVSASTSPPSSFGLLAPPERSGKPNTFTASANYNQREYKESFREIGYPGLTYTTFYTPAIYRATAVDVTTAPKLRIAYLPGTGDAVAEFLPSLGVTPTILTLADLTAAKLKQYDAVLLGVRAYAAHPELAGAGSKPLLDYARAGGVIIVQYNNAVYAADSAPYPLSVPGDPGHNVVVEADPVALLEPSSPLLTWPNKLTAADFNNWVEERGHGFAASFDPRYHALLETHDPEQDPQRGGLLVAPVGKGAYIYCALALYRQLPEGVPGAYRLLANLVSYAKNPRRP